MMMVFIVGFRGMDKGISGGVDDEYAEWLADAEEVWWDIASEVDRISMENARHNGGAKDGEAARGRGPQYRWVTAMGAPATNGNAANRCTLAWAAIARWLFSISIVRYEIKSLSDKGLVAWLTACKARMRIRHMALRFEAEPGMKEIQAWLLQVIRTDCWVSGELHAQVIVARGKLKAEQKSLRDTVHKEWMSFITGGPAEGLRRQHRFLRTLDGWKPASIGRLGGLIDSEAQVVLDKRNCGFRMITGVLGDDLAPLGRQAEAEFQANAWGKHWREVKGGRSGSGEEDGDANVMSPGDEDCVKPITVEDLEAAAKTFPDATGLAWDAIHPKALLRLPCVLKLKLANILNKCEKMGCGPAQVSRWGCHCYRRRKRDTGRLTCLP